jgi:hypothetical protein
MKTTWHSGNRGSQGAIILLSSLRDSLSSKHPARGRADRIDGNDRHLSEMALYEGGSRTEGNTEQQCRRFFGDCPSSRRARVHVTRGDAAVSPSFRRRSFTEATTGR